MIQKRSTCLPLVGKENTSGNTGTIQSLYIEKKKRRKRNLSLGKIIMNLCLSSPN